MYNSGIVVTGDAPGPGRWASSRQGNVRVPPPGCWPARRMAVGRAASFFVTPCAATMHPLVLSSR